MEIPIFLILALAFAPGLFLLEYFYSKDRMQPEPRNLVIRTYLFGLAAAVPIAALEFSLIWAGPLLMSVFVAPVIEEFGKYFSVRWSIYRHPEFDEPIDGIVYGTAAALGFASIENVAYLISASELGQEALWTTAILRAFLSVPAHALFGAMWGYAMGWGLLISDKYERQAFILKGVFLAIAFHGLFNLLAFASGTFGLAGAGALIAVVIIGWRLVGQRIESALRHSQQHPEFKHVHSIHIKNDPEDHK